MFLGESEAELNQQLAAATRRMHALAVAIGDARKQYEATRNPGWLQAVKAYRDEFARAVTAYKTIAAKLDDRAMPSDLMLTLDRTSDWLLQQTRNVVEGTTGAIKALGNPIVLIAVAAAVVSFFTGGIGRRK